MYMYVKLKLQIPYSIRWNNEVPEEPEADVLQKYYAGVHVFDNTLF